MLALLLKAQWRSASVTFWGKMDKLAFIKALLIHFLLVGVVLFSFHSSESVVKPRPVPQHIMAVVIEKPKPKPKVVKKAVIKKAIKKKVKKKAKPKPKKKVKPKVKPKPKAKPKPKVKPKPKPKVEEPSFEDLLASEAKKIKQIEPKPLPKVPAIDKAAKQKAKARAQYIASEVDTYSALISQTVRRYWNRPPSARNGMQVKLKIRLLPGGELNSVSISRSSGNPAFDRAAVYAVERAGNFTVPADSEIFNKHFREFSMLFNPEDLKY